MTGGQVSFDMDAPIANEREPAKNTNASSSKLNYLLFTLQMKS